MREVTRILPPYSLESFKNLHAGEHVLLCGHVLVMRDQAQKKLFDMKEKGENLPIDLSNTVVFYAGPAKPIPTMPAGAIGPTTSKRMDKYLEFLYLQGVLATIGKGDRSEYVKELNKRYRRVYFVTPSGVAALLASRVVKSDILAFEELGPEAIRLIEVRDLPLFVWIDASGQVFRNAVNR
ncbi:MAG: fumarate hydratase subunit beta [Thermotogota bacterium]|nr:fumarate hydratase subunit beta [Thermotogota bacterium]MDK2864961.1 fumarate hydratase subunit beta [Thermotogota bacterium]